MCLVKESYIRDIFISRRDIHYKIPMLAVDVPAGFPSPADDYLEQSLDLNEHLIKHPAATFFMRVAGDSMKNAGIFSGDTLIVDKAVSPEDDSIVIAVLNGEFMVKRLQKKGEELFLVSENPNYKPIKVLPDNDLTIWGSVTYVIHKP